MVCLAQWTATWCYFTSYVAALSLGSGRGVIKQNLQFGLSLPKVIDFASKRPPLVEVMVANGVPLPEAGGDMEVTMELGKDLQLRIYAGAAGEGTALAGATYRNTVAKNGWAYLSVKTTSDIAVTDDLKMYAAGFLEGFASARQIRDFQHNANTLMAKEEADHQAIGNIRALFEKELNQIANRTGMGAMSAAEVADPFWLQTRLMVIQAWGLLDAYNQHVDKVGGAPMSMVDLIILNSDGETPELEMAYDFNEVLLRQSGGTDSSEDEIIALDGKGKSFLQRRSVLNLTPIAIAHEQRVKKLQAMNEKAWRHFKQRYGRCSAMVRLTPNNTDILVGHTTFSDYSEMNRIFKYYDFPSAHAGAHRMAFSSYPGVMGSTDDYYIMDTGLVVTETTVSMLSDEAFDKLNDDAGTIPDYMRIMIANRLATNGKEWVEHMTRSATGTYNSQWMVVDYNKFISGQKLREGTLWVLEQAPGVSHSEDMSSRLQAEGFWASANRAYFDDVRNVSGESDAAAIHGSIYSESRNPRANTFAKTAASIHNLADFRAEMQRNKWPHDVDGGPDNTPDHAIAARGDLVNADPSPNGGVDSKVTNACLSKVLAADAISGPTHDNQKPFRWTDSNGKQLFPDMPHDGLPDIWNFGWVRMTHDGELASFPDGDDCSVKT